MDTTSKTSSKDEGRTNKNSVASRTGGTFGGGGGHNAPGVIVIHLKDGTTKTITTRASRKD